jgi:hypothetical protein
LIVIGALSASVSIRISPLLVSSLKSSFAKEVEIDAESIKIVIKKI